MLIRRSRVVTVSESKLRGEQGYAADFDDHPIHFPGGEPGRADTDRIDSGGEFGESEIAVSVAKHLALAARGRVAQSDKRGKETSAAVGYLSGDGAPGAGLRGRKMKGAGEEQKEQWNPARTREAVSVVHRDFS